MKVAVYCSSSDKLDQKYYDSAYAFGKLLAKNGHDLVYGGYNLGIMGNVAKGIKENGGKVIGVVPTIFKDRSKEMCDEVINVSDMSERKNVMENEADAFVTLPGGIGSMDEFFQIFTLVHLKQHNKKVCIYNFNNFYDDIYNYLKRSVKENFLSQDSLNLCPFFKTGEEIINYLK